MADKALFRVVDANFNRLREGLRVVEEIERLVRSNKKTFPILKTLRHQISGCEKKVSVRIRLLARNSSGDPGRRITCGLESKRASLSELTTANFKRCQEAARVLEEFLKLIDGAAASEMKEIRFRLYDIEKRIYPHLVPISSEKERNFTLQ
ncbi:MAG: hypothetical protein A2293_02280 [Elusimicrobia bacterium RIFOXYB2_FULL_49_7]|nr:MAG: hypothetical protein A2293_02280 [Elusimicrobia bacterium RIFOXYB2_FULL_49_7]